MYFSTIIKQLLNFFGWKLNFDNDSKGSWQKMYWFMCFNDQNTQFPLLQTEPRKLYKQFHVDKSNIIMNMLRSWIM